MKELRSKLLISAFWVFVVWAILALFIRNPVFLAQKTVPGAEASVENLKTHLSAFVGTPSPRNYINEDSLNQSAGYIYKHFQKHCDSSEEQYFKLDKQDVKNIRCFIKGKTDKWIILGAHYDVAHEQPGADDNASGASGLLELARILSKNRAKLKHSVELVAYTLEEPPFFRTEFMGSFYHAQKLKESGKKVAFMISLEMIGYYDDAWGSQDYPLLPLYWFYPLKGNFITLVGRLSDYLATRRIKSGLMAVEGVPVVSINAPASIRGVDFSDHLNYWSHGMEAYMISDTAFYRNKNYHQVTDTMDTLNFDKMSIVVSQVAQLALSY